MKNFNKAVYDLLGAAVGMVILPLIVGCALYVYAHRSENPAAMLVLMLLALCAIAAIAGAMLHWRAGTRQLELMLCSERSTTEKQAEQFGGDPLDDPELDAGLFYWPREAFDTAPDPRMFLDWATGSWRFLPRTWMKRSEFQAIKAKADYSKLLRQASNDVRTAVAEYVDSLSPSEALFAFMGWMTARPQPLLVGAQHDAAPLAVLAAMYAEVQGFAPPREGWEKLIKPMGDRDVTFSRVEYSPESTFGETPSGLINLRDCAPTFGVQPFSLGESLDEDLNADDLLPAPLELVPAGEPPAPYYVPTINRAPEGWPGPVDVPVDDAADLEAVDQELLRKRGGAE